MVSKKALTFDGLLKTHQATSHIRDVWIVSLQGKKKYNTMFWSKMLWKLPSVFLFGSFTIHNVFDMPSVHPCSVKGKPDLVWGVCPTGWSRHHEKVCSGNRGPPNGAAWSSQSNPPHHPVKRNQIGSSWWHTSIISEVSLEEACWV